MSVGAYIVSSSENLNVAMTSVLSRHLFSWYQGWLIFFQRRYYSYRKMMKTSMKMRQ